MGRATRDPEVAADPEGWASEHRGQGMAKSAIPDLMTRRHLLEKALDAKQATALADVYLAEDRAIEALAFLAKAGATDRLESLSEHAIETGDAFLLKAVLEAAGDELHDRDRWVRLEAAAEGAGKTLYAAVASRMANPIGED